MFPKDEGAWKLDSQFSDVNRGLVVKSKVTSLSSEDVRCFLERSFSKKQ